MDPVSSPRPAPDESRSEFTGGPPGTTRPPSPVDLNLLEVVGVLGRMRGELVSIAEAGGVRLPELGATLADLAAFVARLPPGQAAAAGRVLAETNAELEKLRARAHEGRGAMPEVAPAEPQRGELSGGAQPLPSAEKLAERGRELRARVNAHWSQLGQAGQAQGPAREAGR